MSENEQDEFKVKDRRRFRADGTLREDTAGEEEERRASRQSEREKAEAQQDEVSAEVDFSSFLVGLATQVLVLLGEIPHPETGRKLEHKQLAAAKQTIDILGLLELKTKGNLQGHEEQLLHEVLKSVRAAGAEAGAEADGQPEVNFSSFVIGLATQVMVMLGEVPHPETGQVVMQVEAAKQTIDVLGVLEAKTIGNLTQEEDKLLKEVLASVRMAFVHVVQQS